MGRKDQTLDPAGKHCLSDIQIPERGLRLSFRHTPLQQVLNFFHDTAGLTIEVEPNIEIQRRIDLWRDEPVTKAEALKLLEAALIREGYLAIDRIGILTIVSREDAKKHAIPLPTVACSG